MGEFSIRDARRDDAEAFVRAHEVAWDAGLADIVGKRLGELASFDSRVTAFRKGFQEVSPDKRVWVAERGCVIVGLAVCVREKKRCELRDLYVVPEVWGSGAARPLMDAALSAMRDRGAREAILWVAEANARARRFYEREGWTPDGQTRTSPVGPLELRYQRAL